MVQKESHFLFLYPIKSALSSSGEWFKKNRIFYFCTQSRVRLSSSGEWFKKNRISILYPSKSGCVVFLVFVPKQECIFFRAVSGSKRIVFPSFLPNQECIFLRAVSGSKKNRLSILYTIKVVLERQTGGSPGHGRMLRGSTHRAP